MTNLNHKARKISEKKDLLTGIWMNKVDNPVIIQIIIYFIDLKDNMNISQDHRFKQFIRQPKFSFYQWEKNVANLS